MAFHPPRVALLIETSRSYGRGLLRGIARYSRLHGPWSFLLTPGDFIQVPPQMRDWNGDGIVARTLDQNMAETLLEMGLPTVFLDYPVDKLPREKSKKILSVDLTSDSVGASRMAAKYLMEKRLTRFAYAGYPFQQWSINREKAFCDAISKAGYETLVYRPPLRFGRALRWEKEEPYLRDWLKSLPKPIGVMACNDQRGRELLDACESAEINVPEQLAVIGVDADELLCELCSPPLTSVALNAEKGGFLAAQALDRMMRGEKPKERHFLVEPVNVVERRSTNIVLVEDEDVAEALRLIHTGRLETLTVERVSREIPISRRQLEVKFRKYHGRTMLEELQLVRLERAKQMLRETDASMERVAETVGFSATSYFLQTFRRRVGVSPSKYRQESRGE
ncbi:MAG: XylR family transcriptional regulator [Thermoguttaceae bacterium]|nr:XylR family transcriptional regulator [Thermoguttaceae bacterium]